MAHAGTVFVFIAGKGRNALPVSLVGVTTVPSLIDAIKRHFELTVDQALNLKLRVVEGEVDDKNAGDLFDCAQLREVTNSRVLPIAGDWLVGKFELPGECLRRPARALRWALRYMLTCASWTQLVARPRLQRLPRLLRSRFGYFFLPLFLLHLTHTGGGSAVLGAAEGALCVRRAS